MSIKMSIKKRVTAYAILLGLCFASSAYAIDIAPDEIVKHTANDVLEILKSDKDIGNGDLDKIGILIEDKIATKFDFDRMSRLVLGPRWNVATKEQRELFIVEFRSLLIRIYSSALSKYRNQTIDYKPLRIQAGDTEVRVKTEIIQTDGPIIPMDYRMGKVDDLWKVYDVSIDGLSLVSIYRGQFAEELKHNGVDGVIRKLMEKNGSTPAITSSIKG